MARYLAVFLLIAALPAPTFAGMANSVVIVTLLSNGVVEIEGKSFSDVSSLKVKFTEIKRRKPLPELQLSASKTLVYGDAAIDMVLLQRSGLPSNVDPKVKFH